MQNDIRKSGIVNRTVQVMMALAFTLFAACAHSAPKTVLVLGDSLSAEYGLVRGTGWVKLLQDRLIAEKINANIINASISGETTSGGKSRLPALLEQHHPAIVIIELGANDGLRGIPLVSAENNLRTMINTVQETQSKVLLIGIQIPPNYGRDYTEKFSALYTKLAHDTKIPLVPFLLDGVAGQPQLFQADRLHPLAEAQPIMLNNVWPHLKKLLAK